MANNINAPEQALTDEVVASFGATPDARLKMLMQSLVRHLHAFVREAEPTEREWMAAIEFLTATGRICDGVVRQEFILLSDTLGVSMLVDAINHRHVTAATDTTVLGPFYIEGMPERDWGEDMAFTPGTAALVHGRVTDAQGNPIADAVLDVWQSANNRMYSGQDTTQPHGNLRGRYRTDAEGRYAIRTIIPTSYPIPDDGPVGRMLQATGRHPWRPAHLHFMVEAPGYRKLVTHLFNRDDPYLKSDAVFGVKSSLVIDYVEREANSHLGELFRFDGPFCEANYDFVLEQA